MCLQLVQMPTGTSYATVPTTSSRPVSLKYACLSVFCDNFTANRSPRIYISYCGRQWHCWSCTGCSKKVSCKTFFTVSLISQQLLGILEQHFTGTWHLISRFQRFKIPFLPHPVHHLHWQPISNIAAVPPAVLKFGTCLVFGFNWPVLSRTTVCGKQMFLRDVGLMMFILLFSFVKKCNSITISCVACFVEFVFVKFSYFVPTVWNVIHQLEQTVSVWFWDNYLIVHLQVATG